MQNRLKRSNLEPRGPREGLEIAPPSSRRVRSAPFSAEIPNPPVETGLEGSEVAASQRNSAVLRADSDG
eukprot:9602108-Alexandrium_andersonii.AAC.1